MQQLLDRISRGESARLTLVGPSGAGKTALLEATAQMARSQGIRLQRSPEDDDPVGEAAEGRPRLVLIDDPDARPVPAGPGRGVLVTALESSGPGAELRVGGLSEAELGLLAPQLEPGARHAVWLASAGLPGAALPLADRLADLDASTDALVHLALTAPSRSGWLEVDFGICRLLEAAAQRPSPPAERARILARLAREQLGDASAADRRRRLIDEAVALARTSGDAGTLAEVLDSGLRAGWDPAAASERLDTASEIVDLARRAGHDGLERRGLFWRFVALAELGRLTAAEAALTAYGRAADLAGDGPAAVVVLARQATLALVQGRFDRVEALTAEVAARGPEVGLTDTANLVGTLRNHLAALRGNGETLLDSMQEQTRRRPGHLFEASVAWALVEAGQVVEAGLELERLLPAVLDGSGPRWLGAAADLARVAAQIGELTSVRALYDVLLPFQGRLVVWGNANLITGPVDEHLGRLALRLGAVEEAVAHLDRAVELEQRIGALPWLAHTLLLRSGALAERDQDGDDGQARDDRERARSIATRLGLSGVLARIEAPAEAGVWRLRRDGGDWLIEAGVERARIRDGRGMHYLRALLAAPGREIAALDLVAGGPGLQDSPGTPVLDDAGRAAYRHHLRSLQDELDVADRVGDGGRAAVLEAERAAVVSELRRATGTGGRSRQITDESERARVNATRTLWTAVRWVEAEAPLAGAHLRASLHTGRFLRYQPAPGGPARWDV